MLKLTDVSAGFAGSCPLALRNVEFEVQQGTSLAVIGPSGSGKSTLVLALTAIIPHEIEGSCLSGQILVCGRDTRDTKPHQLIDLVGTVLQDPEWQLVRPTVAEEIAFPLHNLAYGISEIATRVNSTIEELGLSDLLGRASDSLSGGQKQCVALAAALATRPKILLLDEVLAELDPAADSGEGER